MSDLFGRVKDRVRSRSRRRKTQSWQPGSSSQYVSYGDEATKYGYKHEDYDTDEGAPAPYVSRVSMDNSAFYVHGQYGRLIKKNDGRMSEEQRGREVVALRDMMVQRRDNPNDQSVLQTLMGAMVPDRASSKRPRTAKSKKSKSSHRRHASSPPARNRDVVVADREPRDSRDSRESHDSNLNQKQSRPNSNHRRNFSRPITGTSASGAPQLSREQEELSAHPLPQLPETKFNSVGQPASTWTQDVEARLSRVSTNHQNRSVPVYDGTTTHLSGFNNRVDIPERSAARDSKRQTNINGDNVRSPNVRLPEGFKLQSGQKTQVTESWQPAVTHENIIKQRTEIVREQITRTIHVHHYYTILQPVKVVEVLPAKHYMIDPRTGWKIEIPKPEGWVMPQHMQPSQPDTSSVKGWTRHYLVNEEYPEGIPESPPLKNELDYPNLRERARSMSNQQYATA